MIRIPIVPITFIATFIAMIAISCLPPPDAGQGLEPKEITGIAGSISYVTITGFIGGDILASPGRSIIPSAATVEYTITPTLPEGITFNKNTGEISGTPAGESDSVSYVVTASGTGDYKGNVDSDLFRLSIGPALSDPTNISRNSLVEYTNIVGVVGKAMTVSQSKSIVPSVATLQYTVTPELPVGLMLNPDTGEISGTPTETVATEYTVVATATGDYMGSITSRFAIAVLDDKNINGFIVSYPDILGTTNTSLLEIPTTTIPPNVDVEYSLEPVILPDGLKFDSATGRISGIPVTMSPSSSYIVRISGTDEYTGMIVSNSFDLAIEVSMSDPQAIDISDHGISYESFSSDFGRNVSLTPTSDLPPEANVVYSLSSRILPDGLRFNSGTGRISGIPRETFAPTPYRVKVTGIGAYTGVVESNLFIIVIGRILVDGTLSYSDFEDSSGDPVILFPTLTTDSTEAEFSYSVTSGSLPHGVTINAHGGIVGVSTEAGIFDLQITATAEGNHKGTIVSDPFTITLTRLSISGPMRYPFSYPSVVVGVKDTLVNVPLSQVAITPSKATVQYEEQSKLPDGLSVDPETGAIVGTPTETTDQAGINSQTKAVGTGRYGGTVYSNEFRIKIVEDSIEISGPTRYPFRYTSSTSGVVGTPISIPLSQNDITPSEATVRYEEQSRLPEGLFVNPETGAIEGIPSKATTGVDGLNCQTKVYGTGAYRATLFSNEFRIKISGDVIQLAGTIDYYFDDVSPVRNSRKNVLSFNRSNSPLSFESTTTDALSMAVDLGSIRYTIEGTNAEGVVTGFPEIGSMHYRDVSFNQNTGEISRSAYYRIRVTDQYVYDTFLITATGIGAYTGTITRIITLERPNYY